MMKEFFIEENLPEVECASLRVEEAIPNSMKTSPTRVVMNAFIAAARAEGFAYQNPISR